MTERIAFTIKLKMKSDWSVGAAAAQQGSIDRLIDRDADGLPYVRASTLRGMWRDAAEQLAFGLDDGVEGAWTKLLPHLFGSQPVTDGRGRKGEAPIAARLCVDDARMDGKLRKFLAHKDSEPLRGALTFVKPGVAIDAASGTARPDFLRFEEMARKGIKIAAQCSIACSGDSDADQALVALAFAALKLVTSIGGKRRRGAGKCSADIYKGTAPAGFPESADAAIEILETAQALEPVALRASSAATSYEKGGDGAFKRRLVTVKLCSPVVVPDEVLGNVVTTLRYIPGTMLLPVLARRLVEGGMDEGAVRAGFANGDIRALPAYPELDGRRSLPTPCVWERKKDDTKGPDGKGELRNLLLVDKEGDVQYKPERDGYFAFEKEGEKESARPIFAAIKTFVRTHNTVDDLRQKPTTDVGGVYSYEALTAGQTFIGELWIRETLNPKWLSGSRPARIGRAKNAGYGDVEVVIGDKVKDDAAPKLRDDKTFTMLVESDIVLRFGAVRTPEDVILKALKTYEIEATVCDSDLLFRRHEGWIAGWNLPRPSLVAIKAGSAVKLEVAGDVATINDKLKNLQDGGLGERRGEGFGRVLVNHASIVGNPCNTPRKNGKNSDNDQRVLPPEVDKEFKALLDHLEIVAARDAIRVAAERLAADPKMRKDLFGWPEIKPGDASERLGKANMSQLGALRAVIGDLSTDDQLKAGRAFLEGREKKHKEKHGEWFATAARLFQHPENIWSRLSLNGGATKLFAFARERKPEELEKNEELQLYALACLFHAGMRAHKRMLEKKDGTQGGTPEAPAQVQPAE